MKATLIRTRKTADCTLGVLVLENGVTFQTLERPWFDNLPDVSCIPEGTYSVIRWNSPSKGDCFKVEDVPAREHILIHVGNEPKDTQGCIIIGSERNGSRVVSSRLAMNGLELAAPDGFTMTVMEQR